MPNSLIPAPAEQPATPSGFCCVVALWPPAPAPCWSPGACKLQETACVSSVALGRRSVKEAGSVVGTLERLPGLSRFPSAGVSPDRGARGA